MKKQIIIIALTLSTGYTLAQKVQMLDLDVPCTYVENTYGKREFPLKHERIDLEVEWIVSMDTLLVKTTSATFDMNETKGDLLFTGFFGPYAMDTHTGQLVPIGKGKFKGTFQQDDLILLENVKENLIYFISLTSGDTLHSIKSHTSVFGYEFFNDSIYYGSYKNGIFAYSLREKQNIWERKELGRYDNVYAPKGDENGVIFIYEYENFRSDTTYKTMYFVSTGEWQETEVKAVDPYVGFAAIDGYTIYFYGRDNAYYSVNVPDWKVNWCISGDWRRPFIKKENKWISTDHEIDVVTGEITVTSNYAWNYIFSEWGDFYVLTAFDGDIDHLYLSTKDYKKIYKPNFVYEGKFPCDMNKVIEDRQIMIANNTDPNRSVAYFNCNGKTHFMGVTINKESISD